MLHTHGLERVDLTSGEKSVVETGSFDHITDVAKYMNEGAVSRGWTVEYYVVALTV